MKLKKINKYYLGMGFFSSNKYIKRAGIKNLLAFLEKKAVFSQLFDFNAVISENQILLAGIQTLRVLNEKESKSKNAGMDFLMKLFAKKQIKDIPKEAFIADSTKKLGVIFCCENENDLKKKFSDLSKEFKLKGAFFSPENLLEKVFFYFNESDLINFKLNNALIENFVLEKMALN